MLRAILSVILGYFAMFVVVGVSMTLLSLAVGNEFAIEQGTLKVRSQWLLLTLPLSITGALIGGFVAQAIARDKVKPVKVLAFLFLAVGVLTAVGQLNPPPPDQAIAGKDVAELTPIEISQYAQSPTWYNFLIPLIGCGGFLAGAAIRRRRSPASS